jgi:Cft2 family RNA processing exonuclease
VICTAGFGHAGASRKLLFDWIDEEENTIIISSGYLPDDSPLNAATQAKTIEDEGRKFSVNATVKQIELSGHADQTELIEFVKRIRPKKTFLIHGNPDQSKALADKINSITDVTIPSNNEDFQL